MLVDLASLDIGRGDLAINGFGARVEESPWMRGRTGGGGNSGGGNGGGGNGGCWRSRRGVGRSGDRVGVLQAKNDEQSEGKRKRRKRTDH